MTCMVAAALRRSDGAVVHVASQCLDASGKCLDASANGTGSGALLVIWPCHNAGNQKWPPRRPSWA
jgi:alpha-glucosidase